MGIFIGRENQEKECRKGSVGPYLLVFFSHKFDVTNDKSLKEREIQGVHVKSFNGPTGKFPDSRWATTPLHAPYNIILGNNNDCGQDRRYGGGDMFLQIIKMPKVSQDLEL